MAGTNEAFLISAVVRTGNFQVLAKNGISAGMFRAHPDEAEWLEKYISRKNSTPSKTALKQQFPEFVIYAVDDAEHWCEKVREDSRSQAMIDLVTDALDLVDDDDTDAAIALIRGGVETIEKISGGINTDFDAMADWQEVYDGVSDRVDRVRATGSAGIPTGFPTLDKITGGFQPGWFCVIAARLGQGKTWTGVRMAWEAVVTGHTAIYFSLEQPRFQISLRVHAFGSKQYAKKAFNPMDLSRGQGFDLRDYKKFLEEMDSKRGSGKFLINDTSRGRVTTSMIAAVIAQKQPDIVFVDYLSLLAADSDDWRGTAKISSELQGIAQRFNIPIVALSQVNRTGIGMEPPGPDNMSQGDSIGMDADVILTFVQQSTTVQKMKLAKFRHGQGGDTWYAKFSPGTGEYSEITPAAAQDRIDADGEVD